MPAGMEIMLTELPYGMRGQVYRSPMPFSAIYDPFAVIFDFYRQAKIDLVVMLVRTEETQKHAKRDLGAFYREAGMPVLHMPIKDFSVPPLDVFQVVVAQVIDAAYAGKNIAMHCHAGLGRTGVLAACMAKIVFDINGETAIRWLRKFIPEAVETSEQHRFIEKFEMPDGYVPGNPAIN